MCPFPSVSQIDGVNQGKAPLVFKDACRTNLAPYTNAFAYLIFVGLVIGSVAIAFKRAKNSNPPWILKSSFPQYVFRFFQALAGRILDVMSYASMYLAATSTTRNNCMVVNSNEVYLPRMRAFVNLDDSFFPFSSCQDITGAGDCLKMSRVNDISNFTNYFFYINNGWPGRDIPEEVNDNLNMFISLCKGFVRVNDIQECGFNSKAFQCERINDGWSKIRQQFVMFMLISISIVVVSLYMYL